jgi:Xaa-Pro aminopeptidase
MHSPEKLELIRASMKENFLDAYIIPSTDPHLGEYVPDHWRIIRWLTGFTGSAATVVITESFAGLWTDSRYFLQAARQLAGTGFSLVRPSSQEKGDYISWISAGLESGSKIGIDGNIFSISRLRRLLKEVKPKGITVDPGCDLISSVWNDRPPLPVSTAFDFPVSFAGRDRSSKIALLRDEMKKSGVDFHLLTSPDDIMWLLNIRGMDLDYDPVVLSFAVAGHDQILLFLNEEKIPYRLAMDLDKLAVVMLPYEESAGTISTLEGASILIDPETTSVALFNSIPQEFEIKEAISIPSRLKCIRNSTETENISKAMVRDGIALTRFFYEIESNADYSGISELSLTARLDKLRSEQENFISLSFPSIVAFNEHAALPHYSATNESNIPVAKGILLVDSGSQYYDGTTDITRTVSIGKPDAGQKKDFTLVLKGMIGLARAAFPSGTYGFQLDILAREHLWKNGLNFGHGTGHGVGYCHSVHEGPQRISISAGGEQMSLMPGMVVSDEPALYREGEYGIRTENLLQCYEDEETEFGKFLRFSTLSLCYIDRALIEKSLLDMEEVKWLDEYHLEVFYRISPYLTPAEKAWLAEKTSPLIP